MERIAVGLFVACLVLAGTVDAASNVVQITYDAAGNVIAIERIHSAPIALTGFNPAIGSTGAFDSTTGTMVATGVPASVDTVGKALARADARDGSPSSATSRLVVR
jgi:YD repeat-containing protein